MFEPRKDNMRGEICLIGQGLFCCQESKRLRGQVFGWETCAIVPVLEDDSNAVGCVGQLS